MLIKLRDMFVLHGLFFSDCRYIVIRHINDCCFCAMNASVYGHFSEVCGLSEMQDDTKSALFQYRVSLQPFGIK